MDGENICPFCSRGFPKQDEFWDHVNALDCQAASSKPPVPNESQNLQISSANSNAFQPCPENRSEYYTNQNIASPKANNQVSANRDSVIPRVGSLESNSSQPINQSKAFLDAKDHISLNGTCDGNAISFNMTELQGALPSSSPNGTEKVNLFSRMQPPNTLTAAAPSLSQSPKWKCTLCKLDFADKRTMINHVQSPEHEAKLVVNKPSSTGDFGPSPAAKPVISPEFSEKVVNGNKASGAAIEKEELIDLVRQVVREELQSMFTTYFNSNNNCAVETPDSAKPSPSETKCIRQQSGSLYCDICSCQITSAANIAAHLDGKKHKANALRFAALS